MKAITLIKYGSAESAFEVRETGTPNPGPDQVRIRTEAFGLNFADVMARKGLYRDAPPIPCILGYEVVGRIDKLGTDVKELEIGDRVVAFTRFGAYAEFTLAEQQAVAAISDNISNGEATALATQYCTAYYCAYEAVNLFEGDHVLIHAAAGGVGTALVQLAKRKGCVVYGTVGSDKKLEYLKNLGVDFPINYRNSDFVEEVMKARGKDRIDVIFDPVGGKNYRMSKKALAYGGKIVSYGVSERTNNKAGIFSDLRLALRFGFLHPIALLLKSKGMIGVNMLRIADNKPPVLKRCMKGVIDLYEAGEIKPYVGGVFNADEIAKAHELLGSRDSIGKIVVEW